MNAMVSIHLLAAATSTLLAAASTPLFVSAPSDIAEPTPSAPVWRGFQLGTYVPLGKTTQDCPAASGFTCERFVVECPGVALPAGGILAKRETAVPERGVVLFFGGGEGTNYWGLPGTVNDPRFFSDLRADGLIVLEVKWTSSWLASAPGEDAGTAHLACRPATVIRHVYDVTYAPLGRSPPVGACGFCVTGNSGGASQSSYALSHYPLEEILDAVIPTSGPPHAAQTKGCLRGTGHVENEKYWYSDGAAGGIDEGYGYPENSLLKSPCAAGDAEEFTSRWQAESVDTGANDLHHPATRVHLILGEQDPTEAVWHGWDYFQSLTNAGSPLVSLEWVPQMEHRIQDSFNGLEALKKAILQG